MKTSLYARISNIIKGVTNNDKIESINKPNIPTIEELSLLNINEIKEIYTSGKHKKLSRIFPHVRDIDDTFIKTLLESRILIMGDDLKKDIPITIGADPEFILKSKATGETVLFSSEFIIDHSCISMSEASLGSDYGLLEIRPGAAESVEQLLSNITLILNDFNEQYKDVEINEVEAIVFDHKKERIRSLMKNDKIDFGHTVQKYNGSSPTNISIEDEESYINVSMSAYDEPLISAQRDNLLTAGGHIHIGGTFVRMLSIEQLKRLIVKMDEEVYNLCVGAETAAGKLRREVYGSRGEFRIKPYGVEYRTPSNAIFWPKNIKVLETVLNKMYNITKIFLLHE